MLSGVGGVLSFDVFKALPASSRPILSDESKSSREYLSEQSAV